MALLKLDKLGPRERWGLGVALVFVLVLLVDRLVVGLVSDRVRAVEAQTATDIRELNYNHGVLRTRGPIEAEYTRLEGVLASNMSDSEAIDVIKGEIDDLARSAGVDLVSMEHRAPTVSEGFTEYVIEIRKFEAPMAGALRFLHEIWRTPGMMRVQKVTITPGGDDERIQGSMLISKIMIPTGPHKGEAQVREP